MTLEDVHTALALVLLAVAVIAGAAALVRRGR